MTFGSPVTTLKIVGQNLTGKAFAQVNTGLKKMGTQSTQTGGILKRALGGVTTFLTGPAGIAAGVGAAVAGFATFAKGAIDAADELGKMATRTGVSVEALSSLQVAARQGGTDVATLETGLAGMSRRAVDAANGSEAAGKGFTALGISVVDSNGKVKDADTLYAEVANKIAAMEDGTQKNAIAQQIFGRSGAALIPVLNGGAKALTNNVTVNEKMARTSEVINDRLDDLGVIFKQVSNVVVSVLLPPLAKLLTWIVDGAKEIGQRLQPVWDKLSDGFKRAQPFFSEVGRIFGAVVIPVLGNLVKIIASGVIKVWTGFYNLIRQFLPSGSQMKNWGTIVINAMKFVGVQVIRTSGFFRQIASVIQNILTLQWNRIGSDWKAIGNEIAASVDNLKNGVSETVALEESVGGVAASLGPITVDTQEMAVDLGDAVTSSVELAKNTGSTATSSGTAAKNVASISSGYQGAVKPSQEVSAEMKETAESAKKLNETLEKIPVEATRNLIANMYKKADESDLEFNNRRLARARAAIKQEQEDRKKALKEFGDAFRAQHEALSSLTTKQIRDNSKFQLDESGKTSRNREALERELNTKLQALDKSRYEEIRKQIDTTTIKGLTDGIKLLDDLAAEEIKKAEEAKKRNKEITDALRDNLKSAVNGLIDGTKSWKDVLEDVKNTALQALANFIIDKIIGGFRKAGDQAKKSFTDLTQTTLPDLWGGFFNWVGDRFRSIFNLADNRAESLITRVNTGFNPDGGGGYGGSGRNIWGDLTAGLTGNEALGDVVSGVTGGGVGRGGGGGGGGGYYRGGAGVPNRNEIQAYARELIAQGLDPRDYIVGYQNGGIVERRRGGRLAVIGEGRFNEAVVPLPNGRAIPVELQGGSSGTVNVSINISQDGSVQSGSNGGVQSAELERRLTDWALQQQRPGGIFAEV